VHRGAPDRSCYPRRDQSLYADCHSCRPFRRTLDTLFRLGPPLAGETRSRIGAPGGTGAPPQHMDSFVTSSSVSASQLPPDLMRDLGFDDLPVENALLELLDHRAAGAALRARTVVVCEPPFSEPVLSLLRLCEATVGQGPTRHVSGDL
jgi:hypothetical protein